MGEEASLSPSMTEGSDAELDVVWRMLEVGGFDCTILGVVEREDLFLLTFQADGKNLMMEVWLLELTWDAMLHIG